MGWCVVDEAHNYLRDYVLFSWVFETTAKGQPQCLPQGFWEVAWVWEIAVPLFSLYITT
jgi:hypothetical protein